ncbi:hypothetical protein INR77_13460 [Erythrobacter sp. SCSIO 43205]|uniref:hypothetical protein n=1 Tax=Erythrobacter sp. SCSIO 43205 TaxID=2779361 RepID=UPI001CA9AA48|nr:hypothetical protein [Erythrobacter sp. SCSIO 43205]UAB77772.1 hypothetical protein INR77_13460 [Erythrobacter sp. SCSIO 43205]
MTDNKSMKPNDDAVHIEDDDARAASSPGILRYILGISLLLAIVAMTLVWVVPAISS